MGAPRSRTPNEPGARDIAGALYPDVDSVEWIPSDDADVFRLSFTSGREPRILKMATHGIRAGWREIGAFPAMRRLGVPEVLAFEHTSDDLPDLGIEFHITREIADPQQTSRAMAELWSSDRARALDVAHWLGDCTGRIESLDWRAVSQRLRIFRVVREAELLAPSEFRAYHERLARGYSRALRAAQLRARPTRGLTRRSLPTSTLAWGYFIGMRGAEWTGDGRVPDDVFEDLMAVLAHGLSPAERSWTPQTSAAAGA